MHALYWSSSVKPSLVNGAHVEPAPTGWLLGQQQNCVMIMSMTSRHLIVYPNILQTLGAANPCVRDIADDISASNHLYQQTSPTLGGSNTSASTMSLMIFRRTIGLHQHMLLALVAATPVHLQHRRGTPAPLSSTTMTRANVYSGTLCYGHADGIPV